ncbi:MAG: VanZ family protein [Eubacteriaceae bacterium]|nr:VanZ family protein [Eubacteriaceae bacterium]
MKHLSQKHTESLSRWIPVMIWMCVIFFFSAQVGDDSAKLSSEFTIIIFKMLRKILPGISQEMMHHLIRKLAHFTVYTILGLLVARGLLKGKNITSREVFFTLLICVLYASSDEFHQLFVPGRGAQITDVLIDSGGSILGILLYRFCGIWKKSGSKP